jgi:hypothetical protein
MVVASSWRWLVVGRQSSEAVERGWYCASAQLKEERSGTQHGAGLARITHYACTLHSVQFVGCRRMCDAVTVMVVVAGQ